MLKHPASLAVSNMPSPFAVYPLNHKSCFSMASQQPAAHVGRGRSQLRSECPSCSTKKPRRPATSRRDPAVLKTTINNQDIWIDGVADQTSKLKPRHLKLNLWRRPRLLSWHLLGDQRHHKNDVISFVNRRMRRSVEMGVFFHRQQASFRIKHSQHEKRGRKLAQFGSRPINGTIYLSLFLHKCIQRTKRNELQSHVHTGLSLCLLLHKF